jgi:hypothetical protein
LQSSKTALSVLGECSLCVARNHRLLPNGSKKGGILQPCRDEHTGKDRQALVVQALPNAHRTLLLPGVTRSDPNRPDDEQYIVRLVEQVITVSVETVKIVTSLPPVEAAHTTN